VPGNFKIFISYRRKGGYDTAKLVYDRLRLDGYSVFFDIDTLRSGSFDKELEMRVKKCKDFILILSSGAFDRLSKKGYNEDEDWVRQEISCALKTNKNIIPLVQEGFSFPENLPDDIKDISRKNSLELRPLHFESTYEKLKKSFLLSKPAWEVRSKKIVRTLYALAIIFLVAFLFNKTRNHYEDKLKEVRERAEAAEMRALRADSMRIAREIEFAQKENVIEIVKETEIVNIMDSTDIAKREEIERVIDSINKVKDAEIKRSTDSIKRHVRALPATPQQPTKAPVKATAKAPVKAASKQPEKKSSQKTQRGTR